MPPTAMRPERPARVAQFIIIDAYGETLHGYLGEVMTFATRDEASRWVTDGDSVLPYVAPMCIEVGSAR